jgi:hypothetical protein
MLSNDSQGNSIYRRSPEDISPRRFPHRSPCYRILNGVHLLLVELGFRVLEIPKLIMKLLKKGSVAWRRSVRLSEMLGAP